MNFLWLIVISSIFGVLLTGCAPLQQKVMDTSNPSKLAAELVASLVDNELDVFTDDLVFPSEQLELLVAEINEAGKVTLNPKVVSQHRKTIEDLQVKWSELRQEAEVNGVLWNTVEYYGCRYKMRQHPSLLPLSMNFEVYIEVGGYFYQIDITSISYEGRYFVFDSIEWKGEVKKPDSAVLAKTE